MGVTIITGKSKKPDQIIVHGGGAFPAYEGETDITPKPHEETILETEGKRMRSDVIVREIPYFKTSNVSGLTVYIGGTI